MLLLYSIPGKTNVNKISDGDNKICNGDDMKHETPPLKNLLNHKAIYYDNVLFVTCTSQSLILLTKIRICRCMCLGSCEENPVVLWLEY